MLNPRPFLAAILLMAGAPSAWSAKQDPKPTAAWAGWQAEEPNSSWQYVYFTNPMTKQRDSVFCRRSDCLSGKSTGMAPLYRLTESKRETGWREVQTPRRVFVPVLNKTITMGTITMKVRNDKVYYASELSNYQYDLAAKQVVQGAFHEKSTIYDPLAPSAGTSVGPEPFVMVVTAPEPSKRANDRITSKPAAQPGKKPATQPGKKPATQPAKKPVVPGKKPVADPVVVTDGLLPSELLWLTFPERDDSKPTNAAKRDQVAANLRPAEKDGYTAKIKAPKDAAAYLDGLKPYAGDEIALNADEQKQLAAAKLQEYKERMSLEVRKEGSTSDLVMAHRITEEYRKLLPKKDPAAKPSDGAGAVQDLKPLTDDELKNLTEAERIAYKARLDQAQAKLEAAKKKKDPAGIAAANEELSSLITEYRKKAEANAMTTVPTTVDELNALTKPQQTKFCKDLAGAPSGGFVGGFQVVEKAKDQLAAAAGGDDKVKGIMSGQTDKGTPVVSAAPQPQIAKTEVDKLRDRCKELMAALPASSSGGSGSLTAKVPGLDTDGKKKEEDKNAGLDTKAGAIGAVGGAFLGMLGGPLGMVIGAIIGFLVFKYANKALR